VPSASPPPEDRRPASAPLGDRGPDAASHDPQVPVDLYGLPALPPPQPLPRPQPAEAPVTARPRLSPAVWLGAVGAAVVTTTSAGVGAAAATAVGLLAGG
jgi:hypothetical protein